jgi:hypothetical protein
MRYNLPMKGRVHWCQPRHGCKATQARHIAKGCTAKFTMAGRTRASGGKQTCNADRIPLVWFGSLTSRQQVSVLPI